MRLLLWSAHEVTGIFAEDAVVEWNVELLAHAEPFRVGTDAQTYLSTRAQELR